MCIKISNTNEEISEKCNFVRKIFYFESDEEKNKNFYRGDYNRALDGDLPERRRKSQFSSKALPNFKEIFNISIRCENKVSSKMNNDFREILRKVF